MNVIEGFVAGGLCPVLEENIAFYGIKSGNLQRKESKGLLHHILLTLIIFMLEKWMEVLFLAEYVYSTYYSVIIAPNKEKDAKRVTDAEDLKCDMCNSRSSDDNSTLSIIDSSVQSDEDSLIDSGSIERSMCTLDEYKAKDSVDISKTCAKLCDYSGIGVNGNLHTCSNDKPENITLVHAAGNAGSLPAGVSQTASTEIHVAKFELMEKHTSAESAAAKRRTRTANDTGYFSALGLNERQSFMLFDPSKTLNDLFLSRTISTVDKDIHSVRSRLENVQHFAKIGGKKTEQVKESQEEQPDGSDASENDPLYDISSSYPFRIADNMTVTEVFMLKAVHGPGILVHEPMKSEWNRLATFAPCDPPEGVFVTSLANAGFFLPADSSDDASKGIKVACAFCSVILSINEFKKRNVVDVHRKASPRCRFVLGEATGNASIADLASTTGEQFLSKYSGSLTNIESAAVLSCSTQRAVGENQKRVLAQGHTKDIATDAEQQAVERPALSFLNFQDPSTKLGASALSNTSLTLPPPLSKQVAAAGQQPSAAAKVAGETVADARASQNITVASALVTTAGSVPFQTATLGTQSPTPDAAAGVSNNQQSRDASASADTSSSTAAAGSQSDSGQGRETAGSAGRSGNAGERQTVTYEDLGIISQKPKRPDMAVTQTRINTFTGWIHEQTHPKEEMAEAGFYYTGHEDLVRCFHCKGGLKTWESSDTPWVEHARWFPKCPFIKLCKGQRFIDAVQKLNNPKTRPTISQEAVTREMKRIEEEERQNLSPDVVLFNNLPAPTLLSNEAPEIAALRIDAKVTEASMNELAERLEEENEEIRSSTMCKMCQTREVNVLFLPCGHLVACAQCAPALTTCAMCRQPVKGSVRVHLDGNKLDSEQEMESTHPDSNSHSAA